MATDPKQFNNKEFQKEFQETASVIKDTLVGLSASMSQAMIQAMATANDEIEKKAIKLVKNDLAAAFKAVTKEADKIVVSNDKFIKGQQTVKTLQRERAQADEKFARLDRARNEALKYGIELTEQQLADYEAAREQVERLGEAQEGAAKQLESKLGGLVGIFDRVSNIPIAGELLNASAASAAMKEELIASGNSLKAFGKGVGAAFAGIEKASVILFLINQAVKVLRFFKDLAFGVSEQVTNIARSMGTSMETARGLYEEFYYIQKTTKDTVYNVRNFATASAELVNHFGYVRAASQDILKSQTLLTQRVGSSAEEAATLNMLFKATGQNSEAAFNSINEIGRELQAIDGIGVDVKTVVSDIAAAGAEAASYYGYSTNALAQASIAARKLGLNLSQTKSVAKGLLDFESSINAQLELSVLTQKQFNFGNAMAKAAMGDIAGATQDVIQQMNQLTAEQRQSPIVLEAMAKASGLSTEELAKQYALQYDINAQKKEYGRILAAEGREKALQFLTDKGIRLAEVREITDRVSASEKFNDALDAAKDAFSQLVSGGVLDSLARAVEKLVESLEWWFGITANEKFSDEQQRITKYGTKEEKSLVESRAAGLQEKRDEESKILLEGPSFWDIIKGSILSGPTGGLGFGVMEANLDRATKGTNEYNEETLRLLKEIRDKQTSVNIDGSKVDSKLTANRSSMMPGAVFSN